MKNFKIELRIGLFFKIPIPIPNSVEFFFGTAIPIPIPILELQFYESTNELTQLLISVNNGHFMFFHLNENNWNKMPKDQMKRFLVLPFFISYFDIINQKHLRFT